MSLTSKNIFAALDTKKAKKKKSSEKTDKKKKSSDKKSVSAAELERQIFSQPSLSISNWADCDDEDEDIEPLPESWGQPAAAQTNGPSKEDEPHEADESDEEVDLEQELGVELAHDEEEELEDEKEDQETIDGVRDLPSLSSAPSRRILEPERQLSKKELKQKELDELSKVFEELGIAVPEGGPVAETTDKKKKKDKKSEGNGLHDLTPAPSQDLEATPGSVDEAAELERKKKNKKKKEKSAETVETSQPEPVEQGENGLENGVDESKLDPAQVAARLAEKKKKAAAAAEAKKKLSAAALAEAKLRAKKLAKQKDTKHYNQAPQR